jgi:hypothetical protein
MVTFAARAFELRFKPYCAQTLFSSLLVYRLSIFGKISLGSHILSIVRLADAGQV